MNMGIKIREYLRFVQRWWWLLVISAVVPMVVSYYFASQRLDLYETRVTLMVGTSLQSANPDTGLMAMSRTLADAYARLVTYDPITEAVVERLGLERSREQLASQITALVYPEAQLLEIRVIDTNPQTAALIANTLADELIARTPAADEVQQFEAGFTRQQLDDLRARIEKVQVDIQELSASMLDFTSAAEIQDAQERLQGLREIESMYQSTYAQLVRSYIGDSPNILQIFDPAVEPRSPIGRKTMLFVGVSGVAGVGLALAVALFIEYLDDSVRWEGEAKRVLLDLPVLGAIPKMKHRKGSIVDIVRPESPSAEMVRALRTSIFLSADSREIKALLITSPSVRTGKTFAVAQLGLTIAASGRRVIMVDADLRAPALHELFELPNLLGLSELLAGDGPLEGIDRPKGVQETAVENLYLLPAGKPPLDTGWLLASPRAARVFDVLREWADVILIDSPPGLAAPDAQVLSTAADGTILVVSAGATSRSETLRTKERLAGQDGARLLGVAFNRVKVNGPSTGYYGYGVKHRRLGRFLSRLSTRLPLASKKDAVGDGQTTLYLAEMADYLGVSQATARRWCKSGRLPASKSWFRWHIQAKDLQRAAGRMVRIDEM
jgi:succinoglycan biosynthesis transport protein ExoP